MKQIVLSLMTLLVITSCQSKKSSQGESFLGQVNQMAEIEDDSDLLTFFDKPDAPLKQKFENLPVGNNRPTGWMLDMMNNDLESGMVGALDDLYPGIKKDDIFNTNRRGGMEDIPEMGDLVLTGDAWEKSIMWWNSETAGNWWDGFVRHAFLTNNEKAIEQSHKIVENLLASQDEDGYIGIYKENLRYQHEGANGELWAQTTAFRTMLAYYEFTGKKEVLDAVEKAMAVTIERYGPEGRNPFYLKTAFGGATHGLMLTDVCETLHRLTKNAKYLDYSTYLYRAFSTYGVNRAFNDVRYPYLLQKDSLFESHGVHTYEHLRSLINAYYNTGYPELETAYNNAMYKLDFCILPSGAGHGQEWIAKLKADPTYTHTEFCTMLELRNFYLSAAQKTGDINYADRAEKLTFNGMMGARYPDGKSLTYAKGDNCCILNSYKHGKEESHYDSRYKYSPTHSDPAVCCVPNYTRNYTYYLANMWMKAEDGLAAVLYGPSKLTTKVNRTHITIQQITSYPFSDKIKFVVSTDEPVSFALYFRKPQWTKELKINMAGLNAIETDGFFKVEKEWNGGDVIEIEFVNKVERRIFRTGDVYFQRGALVYAYPIEHSIKNIKDYKQGDFHDFHCFPKNEKACDFITVKDENVEVFDYQESNKTSNPWYQSTPILTVDLGGTINKVQLEPMGNTVLRQVAFPVQE
ncbi:beta-L-arabinofuranosidase domain-containing protein [Marinilabilia rubra]|uniref:Glycosyl hydrolase n=1 Tax=Marinilabilia rubra TaxID=2162893 RepID=A0A2U2BC39_9BACT|nr:beta-L-arabinofuranosidase domain-containing protein [Marinilabilia rubra]PWE00593.1 hypothetical protein DDZ16_03060 [Marinilabilia rubra]